MFGAEILPPLQILRSSPIAGEELGMGYRRPMLFPFTLAILLGGEGAFSQAVTAALRSRISTASGAAPMLRNPRRTIAHAKPALSLSQP
jgi:hypothetical protein